MYTAVFDLRMGYEGPMNYLTLTHQHDGSTMVISDIPFSIQYINLFQNKQVIQIII